MTARVREQVQDDEVQPRAMNNIVVFIAAFEYPAKDAARLAVSRCDVFVSPGTPDVFHRSSAFAKQSESRNQKYRHEKNERDKGCV